MSDATRVLRSHLSATFDFSHGHTIARLLGGSAPLELRGPFECEGAADFYLRNVSSGIFAGDRYDVRLRAGPGTRAIVRPTSATALHAMPEGCARSRTALDAAPGAALVYVEGPLILQQGADFRQKVEIAARPGALIAYAEVVVLGRLACGESIDFRRFDNEIIVRDGGEVRYSERFSLVPGLHAATIFDASAPVLGTLIVAGAPSPPGECWSDLELDDDGYVAGYDTLPAPSSIVLRCAGSRLEPVSRLLDAAIANVVTRFGAGGVVGRLSLPCGS